MTKERIINGRMYKISERPDGRFQVVGCEEYNGIVGPVYIETDELYIFDHHFEMRDFLRCINGGKEVKL